MSNTPITDGRSVVDVLDSILGQQKQRAAFEPGVVRHFTVPSMDVFDMFRWEKRDVVITDKDGKKLFEGLGLEFPVFWSMNAAKITAEKYFRFVELEDGSLVRETSVRQMVKRVAGTIARWARHFGHVKTDAEQQTLFQELSYLLVSQSLSFNSPVWFNVGTRRGRLREEQASACFINSIEDDMESILELGKTEGKLYKGGSGSGANYSKLRSSREGLSGGGTASGPVPFIASHDAGGGAIKSGGTTRRAAKMNILNVDHGDIMEFIDCKAKAEKMAHALIDAGFDGDFRARFGAYQSVPFQNANHSVRVTDEFMQAVDKDEMWNLMARDGKSVLETLPARQIWRAICDAAWICGDPGLQFDTIINDMHTCPANGRINASNPCQPAFAPILTPEGISTLGRVEIGSTIWSGSQWTRVKRKIATGVKPVFRYHTRAGSFIGTEQHLVFSNGVRTEACDAETIDTCAGGSEGLPLAGFEQAVVDGLLVGDGSVRRSNNGANTYFTLCVGKDDQDYFTSEIASLLADEPFDRRKGEAYADYRVNSTMLTPHDLPRTYERTVPDPYFYGNELTVRAFLRGLFSANGSVCGGRVTLKASSFAVIDRVQQMLSAIGIPSYYTTNKAADVEFENGVYECRESYDLNITHGRRSFRRLIGFIQADKQRRLTTACEAPERNWSKTSYEVVRVEALGEMPVWDIEVDADEHSYWTGGLRVSNCSEYMHVDDSACNLASLNLRKFQDVDGGLVIDNFEHAIDIAITAMDALVDGAAYPTKKIQDNAHALRQLGLGYANLGSFLMNLGDGYDSGHGRLVAGMITAIMCGRAYHRSAELSSRLGPFQDFPQNRTAMLGVIQKHKDAVTRVAHRYREDADTLTEKLVEAAQRAWIDALQGGMQHGYRNSQTTVLAPTGTIAFMMDCSTTGIEPDVALVKHKSLVGGGHMKIVNTEVESALRRLQYTTDQINDILKYVEEHGSVVGSAVRMQDLRVFDTAFPEPVGNRSIDPAGHVLMMGAVQPFLSGAISKTCNMPKDATPEQISELYRLAWLEGLKAIAIYRDGCKRTQPLQNAHAKAQEVASKVAEDARAAVLRAQEALFQADKTIETLRAEISQLRQQSALQRRKMPDDCRTDRHKFKLGDHKGYLHMGMYPDGSLGEIFIKIAKEGSTVSGLMDTIATLTSYALQYGIPLEALVKKFKHSAFEPAGWTSNPDIRYASSIVDYVFRVLEQRFIEKRPIDVIPEEAFVKQETTEPLAGVEVVNASLKTNGHTNGKKQETSQTGRTCPDCGNLTVRTGSCYSCPNCGFNSGCG